MIPQEAYKNATWGDKTAQQLNNYMQAYDSYPGVTNTGVLAPFNDFIRNYEDMEKNALIGSDNFFHCKANYEAAKRGAWGELVGKGMSAARELYGLAKGEPFSDVRKDWHANQRGWNGAKQGLSLEQACPTDPKEYVEIKDYEDVF